MVSSNGSKTLSPLRSLRAATRIWCTESGESRRTPASWVRRARLFLARCAWTAHHAGSWVPPVRARAMSGSVAASGPRALPTFETVPPGTAPARTQLDSDDVEDLWFSAALELDLELAEHGDDLVTVQYGHRVVRELCDESPVVARHGVRRPFGAQGRDDVERGGPREGQNEVGQGIGRCGADPSFSGKVSSSRVSARSGSLRCQPSSDPPSRRRRLTRHRASRRSGVSR